MTHWLKRRQPAEGGQLAEGTPLAQGRQLAEITSLADGTLRPAQRARVMAELERSPELRSSYERQLAAVSALRAAAEAEHAPQALRERLAHARPRENKAARAPARRRQLPILAALAACAAVIALVVPGGAGEPTVAQAAALALRPAGPAPAVDRRSPGSLVAAVGPVAFPDWRAAFGWRASGLRSDRLDGHVATTVFYESGARRVAYTILSVPALARPPQRSVTIGGIAFESLRVGGRAVVTWRRDGQTCVLSSAQLGAAALERLASYAGERY